MPTLGNTPRPAYVYDTETDTWVPIGIGAHTHDYIPNTLVDAKGDILTATADNVPARLAKGSDGAVLVSDSTTSTGLAWQPYGAQQVAGKNLVINGGMDIWQRGNSFASSNSTYVFTADRWEIVRHGYHLGMTVSRQSAGLDGFRYCARIQRDSGNTSTNNLQFQTSFETSEVLPFINKQMTISFYARKSSTSSSSSINAQIISGTGTDQAMKNYTGGTVSFQQTFTLTDSWQRFSFSGTVSSPYNEFGIWFGYTPSGTAGAADYVEITGVQIELGSIATQFSRAGGTIQGELAACQRYYYRVGTDGASSSFFFSPLGMANATTQVITTFQFPQVMRIKPSSIDYTNPRVWDGVNSTITATSLTFGDASTTSGSINTNGSGFTLYRNYWLMNNGGSYIGFNAEL
jgi:hypothetical protein